MQDCRDYRALAIPEYDGYRDELYKQHQLDLLKIMNDNLLDSL